MLSFFVSYRHYAAITSEAIPCVQVAKQNVPCRQSFLNKVTLVVRAEDCYGSPVAPIHA